MTNDQPFQSVWELSIWSYEHVLKIEKLVKEFSASKPYELVSDVDIVSGEYVHKVRLIKPLPTEIALLTFDAIHALRAVLDQAIFASGCVLLGREPTGTKFPFGVDREAARKDAYRKKSEADPDIIEAALDCEPFDVGDRLLRKLNELRNMKHHRMLAAASLRAGSLTVQGGTFVSRSYYPALTIGNGTSQTGRSNPVWNSATQELILFRSGSIERKPHVDVEVVVSFGDETPFEGERIMSVLLSIGRKIEHALSAIEAKTNQLAQARATSPTT